MKENNLKLIWRNIHEINQDNMETPDTLKICMQKSHSKIISKIMNELKLKILIYSVSLFVLISLILYAFVYLNIEASNSIFLPFVLAGSFLIFKVVSEINRYLVFNNRNDNLSIKDSTIIFRKKLERIKNIDYYITFALCYGIAIIFLFSYIFNLIGIKEFIQTTGLSILLFVFVLLLFTLPWIIRKSFYQRYTNLSLNLKNTLNYFDDDVSSFCP
jgi:amino acid transporter